MKPCNFKGRVNARRKMALERMKPQAPKKVQTRQEAEAEYARLASRIQPQAQAEAIRTKKARSGQGKLARSA